MNPLSIRLCILRLLATAKPYALPQQTLLDEVNHSLRPPLSAADLLRHLSWLKTHDMAGFKADAIDPDNSDARKWFIREAGEVALES